jgi:outer membrane protein assembly factor BamB
LLLIDRGKGTLIAERSVGADATGLLTASLHQFLIQDRGNYLTSLDSHGIEQWSVKVGKLATAPSVNETMIVVPTASPNEVLAIDRGTGALLWSQSLADAPIATPLLEKRTMLIATRNGIESRSLTNGSQLAQWDGASNTPTGELVSSGLLLLFVNELGELVVFDIETGKSKARIPNVRRRQTPLVSRNIVIYHSPEGNLLSCDISKREPAPELWFDLAAVPGLTAPGWLLLKDSRIFTVQPGRGLACLGGAP